eukprot:sb/3471696/
MTVTEFAYSMTRDRIGTGKGQITHGFVEPIYLPRDSTWRYCTKVLGVADSRGFYSTFDDAGLQAILRELYEEDKTFYTNGNASTQFLKSSLPEDSVIIDIYDMMGSVLVSGISSCPMRHSARLSLRLRSPFELTPGLRPGVRADRQGTFKFFNQGTGGGVFLTLFQTRISPVSDEVEVM